MSRIWAVEIRGPRFWGFGFAVSHLGSRAESKFKPLSPKPFRAEPIEVRVWGSGPKAQGPWAI